MGQVMVADLGDSSIDDLSYHQRFIRPGYNPKMLRSGWILRKIHRLRAYFRFLTRDTKICGRLKMHLVIFKRVQKRGLKKYTTVLWVDVT